MYIIVARVTIFKLVCHAFIIVPKRHNVFASAYNYNRYELKHDGVCIHQTFNTEALKNKVRPIAKHPFPFLELPLKTLIWQTPKLYRTIVYAFLCIYCVNIAFVLMFYSIWWNSCGHLLLVQSLRAIFSSKTIAHIPKTIYKTHVKVKYMLRHKSKLSQHCFSIFNVQKCSYQSSTNYSKCMPFHMCHMIFSDTKVVISD